MMAVISFEHETPDAVTYRITCIVHKPRPAVLSVHPDDQSPAEGGEVEDLEIYTDTNDRVPDEFIELLNLDMDQIEQEARAFAFEGWAE